MSRRIDHDQEHKQRKTRRRAQAEQESLVLACFAVSEPTSRGMIAHRCRAKLTRDLVDNTLRRLERRGIIRSTGWQDRGGIRVRVYRRGTP